jgi:hypothetical protein
MEISVWIFDLSKTNTMVKKSIDLPLPENVTKQN